MKEQLTNKWRWLWLFVLTLMSTLSAQASDWVLNESKYNASMSGDHLCLEVFLADLDSKNTYAKEGTVIATNGSKSIDLLKLKYINQGDDESQTAEVKGQLLMPNAKAYFTNTQAGDLEIGTSEQSFWLTKWGSDYHYMTAKINLYYNAEMAGGTWKIYFHFKHSNDDWYDRVLRYSIETSSSLGMRTFDASQFKIECSSPDKLKFTAPKLYDDIDSKFSKIRMRECKYAVRYTFYNQDGTTVYADENYEADKTMEKSFECSFPDGVGNPTRIDYSVTATHGVKDASGTFFSKATDNYSKTNAFQIIPVPGKIVTEYRQFDKQVALVWTTPSGSNYLPVTPYIYRIDTDAKGNIASGKSWSKRGTLSSTTGGTLNFTDDNVSIGNNYKYMVVNVPTEWINKGVSDANLTSPSDELLGKLSHSVSEVMSSVPSMNIFALQQDTTVVDAVRLTWQYSRVPTDAANVDFKVMRQTIKDGPWSEIQTVNGDANPSTGATLSFSDDKLPNNSTRYQYKIRLQLSNDKYVFDSDVLSAGLLTGSQVRTFAATKGTHTSAVSLKWETTQVGTEGTTYVVSRRYVNSGTDFMQLYTTTSTAKQFTYEDKTVQPGFYYEYRVEAYNAGALQNSLYDVGFCQARGIISGRVTFGSGTGVEDVRLSLQPSNTGDDNTVKGYSQYVEGVSTGIEWDADSTTLAKVFGADKDYTIQLFVRPGDNISEGAIIGTIPSLGNLLIGRKISRNQGDIYEIYAEQASGTIDKVDRQFNAYKDIQCLLKHADAILKDNGTTSYFDDAIGGWVCGTEAEFKAKEAELKANGYEYFDWSWFKRNSGYNNDVGWFCYAKKQPLPLNQQVYETGYEWTSKVYKTGMYIPVNAYSLVTVQHTGSDDACTLTINGETKKLADFYSYVETKSHSKMDSNVGELGSYFHIFAEKDCLYRLRGMSHDAFLKAYEGEEDFFKQKFFTVQGTRNTSSLKNLLYPFSVGGASMMSSAAGFVGNFTEVRVWDHTLSEKEQTSYADRVLNGREQGLALYWPMDEGLQRYVFDASYTNDAPNGRHATVGNNIMPSAIVPADNQLSRYAVTNENGEYIIRGIPFLGTGSTYTINPTKGIHEFNPISRNGFIGSDNLTLNSYDFTDNSSFPVKGKITYLNTNIPVDSVQFMIDGTQVQSKTGVRSDANGEYEISVPIGEHLIECYKDGHRFTSFPLDGSTYEFKKAETVNFVDSTLVNVTGRINGGFTDQNEPVGFNRSVNRLGKATMKLSLGKESQCSFNYIVDDHGNGEFGTENIPVESATANIKSTAYRAGGKHDDTYYIYIDTDPETGEFSAMLPPLKYKVESITFKGDKDGKTYNNADVFTQNLPLIDATNTNKERMSADSIRVGDKYQKYAYSAKMIRQYRAEPKITVKQKDTKNGAFGDFKVAVRTFQNETDTLEVIKYTDTGYTYKFGYPMFVQNKSYDFDINVSENYKNVDTGEAFTEIPRDAIVSISNDASVLSSVTTQKETIDGKEEEAGMTVESPQIQIQPDSTGLVAYSFIGGWPNLAEGHLRNMSVSVTVDGRTTMWEAPGSRSDALDLVLLGCLPTGTNFMTEGPDKVDYILRRPPGSTSVASFEETEITAHNKSTVNVVDESSGPGLYVSLSPTFKIGTGVGILGPILMTDSKWEFVAKETVTKMYGSRDEEYYTDNISYTLSEKASTPNSMPYSLTHGEYRPENGDTYVGHATNRTFSKARTLGIFQNSDSTYVLTEKDGIAMSESFKTDFVYTQEYIEDYLIPNWKSFIADRLIHVEGNHWDEKNPQVKKVPGEIRYYTSYKPGDKEYGQSNGNPMFDMVRKERKGWCSYRMVNGLNEAADNDEVNNAINQVLAWEETIASNELDKLRAFDDNSMLIGNFSISGGTSYGQTEKNDTVKNTSKGLRHTTYENFNSETKFGALINDAGVNVIVNVHNYDSELTDTVTLKTRSKTVAWTMSDADTRTALSVDVYKSPQGWGPIFRTRAGQTVNPYEPETRTEYYKKGDESEKLNEATMRVEVPQLRVDGSTEITDVPTGGEARFKLQLFNGSETNDYCTYVLQVKENSNPNGAVLTVDGNILSNGQDGRRIKMAGNETVNKTLVVTQGGDRSITDYEDIQLVLKSEKDVSVVSDPVKLRVHFVPASAHVDLSVNHLVLNKADRDSLGGVIVTMYNIDRQNKGLKGMRLRYRRKGIDTWNVFKQWAVSDTTLLKTGYAKMPDGSQFEETLEFPADGIYEVQAQTFGTNGTEEVTYQSEIIEVTQDTHGPQILGMISPENGQLTYMNRNSMHLRFNEELNGNAMSKSDNFRIEGGMNNVVAGGAYPDVAVQLNGDRIETQAMYDLTNSDYAFDMWLYRQGDGTIISLGTEDNLLSLSTHDGGKLRARVGDVDDVFETGKTLPENKWMYMALDYKRKTTDDPQNRITMLYAIEDKSPNYIGQNVPASDLDGHGKLSIGGDGMQGMISELSVWNSNVTAKQLYETRNQVRASYTPGLVGYWVMDEGHGTQVSDRVRSRHMYMDSESWYINNENRAAHLNGGEHSPLKIDIGTFNPANTDNFAYEMWFRGTEAENPEAAALMFVSHGFTGETIEEYKDSVYHDTKDTFGTGGYYSYNKDVSSVRLHTSIGFGEGKLMLKQFESYATRRHSYDLGKEIGSYDLPETEPEAKRDVILSDNNYLDGNWHHLALNIRRGTSAIVYVDGEPVKVLPEASVPGISAHYLAVGGVLQNDSTTSYHFKGDVDEIRIWDAALDGQLISERMYERMDNSYPGLVGYFPMEEIHRTSQGNVVTDFSIDNFGESTSRLKMVRDSVLVGGVKVPTIAEATNAPALKPGSTKMRLADTQFEFTASDDEIYFSFPDSSLPLMDDNDFVATVSYIKDEHGNNSETVQWQFHADFASVKWRDNELIDRDFSKPWNDSFNWSESIYNMTGTPQSYEISGLPSWMTVDKPVGTIDGDMALVNFSIGTDVPVGRYPVYLYLTDRLGIRRVLQFNVTVKGDEPNWSVNPDLYESNMMLTGQIYIEDKISEYTDSKVAAFDDMGQCRGVASPEYVSTRDAYYVNMIVYGASATEISSGETDLTFKMYDASTGKTYPIVNVTLPGKEPLTTLRYAPDAIYGSYDSPVVFSSTDLLQQTITLPTGWSWMSIYVQPTSNAISDILPKSKADRKKFMNIKSHNAIASVNQSNATVLGSLKEITPGNMYKIQVSSKVEYSLIGSLINVRDTAATIYNGWNWIGTLSNNVMSVKDAFADLDPVAGDVVKTRTAFASYRGDGIWEGTLQSIVPGVGYIYNSKATEAKSFHYPLSTGGDQSRSNVIRYIMRANESQRTAHYDPVDNHLYPDNMNIIAVVKKDGAEQESAEIGAFVNGECRGAADYDNGYYFLTIMGSSADDLDNEVEVRVSVEGEEYVVTRLPFVSDAVYGSLENPYMLDIDATAIRTVSYDDEADDTEWYTLQGQKIGRKPTRQGVYIHHGQKVVLKRNLFSE